MENYNSENYDERCIVGFEDKRTHERIEIPEVVCEGRDCYVCGEIGDPRRSCGVTPEDARDEYKRRLIFDENVICLEWTL